ncbi:helix-turn-helix domain-containing protein [Robinsoniella peoriensis]|uniref:Helix-turn-helix domain protein n=1 Tax=Robinsoniella peoriensis TaxID=180332 RepID=A0A4U8Q9S2_9FIRM|nr:helix-turn-helix domain-containing protein [Robinsoniella peoriensis]MDU7026641.1 helix-turn-helix domain-containing protein [Clostridiales bacterium]TLD00953.1 Helix-turn-helix domain protein [Robinsoniella peoriensis]
MEFYQIYKPLTATPFKKDETYIEIEPCDALKPYIRCFWGTEKPIIQPKSDRAVSSIVTPDTCMDIMFDIDYTDNKLKNNFSGINNSSFQICSQPGTEKRISKFAIRFYAWAVILFSEESMVDAKNMYCDVGYYFSKLKKLLENRLFDTDSLTQRKAIAENYLLENYHPERINHIVTDALFEIFLNKGNIKTLQLAREVHISSRQLERLFKENIGISPKQLSSIIRYQYLWNDIVKCRKFDVLHALSKYHYTDQSHLLHDFKRFHSMSIQEAKNLALKDVAFLQENENGIKYNI